MSFSILGTGKAVPDYVLTNDELSTMVDDRTDGKGGNQCFGGCRHTAV